MGKCPYNLFTQNTFIGFIGPFQKDGHFIGNIGPLALKACVLLSHEII